MFRRIVAASAALSLGAWPAAPASAQERVQVEASGPARGPAKAPVTIVEFSDFQCPYCARSQPTLEQVLKRYPQQVRLVFRNFPLPIHDEAEKAAQAGVCADEQGRFWELHERLFADRGALDVNGLKRHALELRLDVPRFDACLDSRQTARRVKQDLEAGTRAGVTATPTFFVNGRPLVGARPLEAFVELIEDELARR